jgi:hypothetical protein
MTNKRCYKISLLGCHAIYSGRQSPPKRLYLSIKTRRYIPGDRYLHSHLSFTKNVSITTQFKIPKYLKFNVKQDEISERRIQW